MYAPNCATAVPLSLPEVFPVETSVKLVRSTMDNSAAVSVVDAKSHE